MSLEPVVVVFQRLVKICGWAEAQDLAESVHFRELAQMASLSASAIGAETLTREILKVIVCDR